VFEETRKRGNKKRRKENLLIHGSLGTADEFDHERDHVVVIAKVETEMRRLRR